MIRWLLWILPHSGSFTRFHTERLAPNVLSHQCQIRLDKEYRNKLIFWNDPFRTMKKIYSVQDLRMIQNKLPSCIVVEPKVDGIGCSVQYKNGQFVQAFTKKGFIISEYVRNLSCLPRKAGNFTGIVRGELFAERKKLELINCHRKKVGFKEYSSVLSLLKGFLRSKIVSPYMYDYVDFFGYHVISFKEDPFLKLKTQLEVHECMKKLGFNCFLLKKIKYFKNNFALIEYIKHAKRHRFDSFTDIDGLILKPYNIEKNHFPHAFKFDLGRKKAIVESIHHKKSKNRKYVLVKIFPIKFKNGRTISRVYLDNSTLLNHLRSGSVVTIRYKTRPTLSSVVKY